MSLGTAAADPINWESLQISEVQDFNGYFGMCLTNLPDGRFVFGQQGKLFVQDVLGSAAKTEVAANGNAFDPSFVAVRNATDALMGVGMTFGSPSGLHPFDPGNLNAGSGGLRPVLAASAQNYSGVYWHSPTSSLEGWLIGGMNVPGSPFSGHNVIFVSLDGTKSGLITESLCTYSGPLAADSGGNLYAGLYEPDNSPDAANVDKVIRFSAAQLEPKIQAILNGTPEAPLTLASALFLHKFQSSSSIAVDGLGRIWATGFNIAHVQVYDPLTGALRNVSPVHPLIGGGQVYYQLSAFTQGGIPRMGVLAYNGYYTSATPIFFLQAPAADVSMPTDTTFLTWRIAKFGAGNLTFGTEASHWGVNADPDLDGLSNLEEYAMGTEPLSSDGTAPLSSSQSGGLLAYSFIRHPLNSDLNYTVEVSSTMAEDGWTAIASSSGGATTTASGASAVEEVDVGDLKRVTITDELTALGQSPRFMRLRLSVPTP